MKLLTILIAITISILFVACASATPKPTTASNGKVYYVSAKQCEQNSHIVQKTGSYSEGHFTKDTLVCWDRSGQITQAKPMSSQAIQVYQYNQQQEQRKWDKLNKSIDKLNDDMKEQNRQLNDNYQQEQNRNNVYNFRIVN